MSKATKIFFVLFTPVLLSFVFLTTAHAATQDELAEEERLSYKSTNEFPEEETNGVFHVENGHKDKVVKVFYEVVDGKLVKHSSLVFNYDIRGYLGEAGDTRGAQVQFFMDSQDKQGKMYALSFCSCTKNLEPVIYGCKDVFEANVFYKTINFKSGFSVCLRNKMKHVYIDPEIKSIGNSAFSDCKKLETIDIVNKEYALCKLNPDRTIFCKDCFHNIGNCRLKIFDAFDGIGQVKMILDHKFWG